MCENKDRPDLELERLVMGDRADGVRPSEGWLASGWLVRDDVVRGAVEMLTDMRDQVEALTAQLEEEERMVKRLLEVVLRALCGEPALKPILVWCGVDPNGRVMPTVIGKTREACWWALVWSLPAEVQNPKQAMAEGFTVRRFRLEEVG